MAAVFAVPERRRGAHRGQALVEFALVAPVFLLVLFSVIALGLAIFYQAEITNAARQAARYAAIHSSTAQCPTTSWLTPQAPPLSYYACDAPATWPGMKAAATNAVWGLAHSGMTLSACWSSYQAPGNPASYDYPAVDPVTGSPNTFAQCQIAGVDPVGAPNALSCPAAATTSADDKGSDKPGNYVTVYACYQWVPPLAGFILIPSVLNMKAVVTEVVQRQQ
ncbi:MAG TPA: TadE family protein [Candidatus Dormibacteraeota bacterium]|nr:TadE family protein [Candidatus Dormibacteraeota bacterium]